MPENIENKREFVEMVPGDIRRAVNGLAGDNQFAVLALLLKEQGASFSEIKSKLELHQQSVSNALDSLQSGGIIKKREAVDNQSYSTNYEVTEFGHRLTNSLLDTVEPRDDVLYSQNQIWYQDLQNSNDGPAAVAASDVYATAKSSQRREATTGEQRFMSDLTGVEWAETA